MSQEEKDGQNNKNEENNQLENKQKNENNNSNTELNKKINEINTKILNSKNDFLTNINKLITDIQSKYDKYISDTNKKSNDIINDKSKNDENIKQYLSQLEIDFQNIENIENSILEESNYLIKILEQKDKEKEKNKKENEKILKINCCSDVRECKKKLVTPNSEKIEKIIIKEIASNILEEIFLDNNDDKNGEAKENKSNENKQYKDIIIKKCNLEDENLSKMFPNINKFKLKKCQISFNPKNFFNFNNINELYLENIGLVNESFNTILSDLKSNNNFVNNIKIFSIKSNNISIFNLSFDNNGNNKENESNKKYNNLQFLNLSNNKIGKVDKNIFDLLPSIKAIDLTNNNISFYSRYKSLLETSKEKKCFLLLSKNPGVIKEKNREAYCNYIKDVLPSLNDDCQLKCLNLEGLFYGKTYSILSSINISNINIHLNVLNLSCNNLNNEDFIKLIGNNNKENKENSSSIFMNIKKLILCSNIITEEGLDMIIKGNHNKIFTNLRKLDLSGNPIKFQDLKQFKKFISGFPKLKNLLLRHTTFESDFNNYLKIRVTRKMEENQKKELSAMSATDLQFEEFFEKEHYLKEKTKLNLKLMNTNGYKCLSIVRKYFPYLLENIKIETKFIDEDRFTKIMT